MELQHLKKVKRYSKNYELIYLNKKGKKTYEIVGRHDSDEKALGNHVSGVSIVAYHEDKLLLLRNFAWRLTENI